MPKAKRSIVGALEVICEIFCHESQWPSMIQVHKELRKDNIFPKSRGKGIIISNSEHMTMLLFSIATLVYYRRTVDDAAKMANIYYNLTVDDNSHSAGDYISTIIDDEIERAKHLNTESEHEYVIRIHLNKLMVEALYYDKAENNTDIPTRKVSRRIEFGHNSLREALEFPTGPAHLTAAVEIPGSAIRRLAEAWLERGGS